MSTLTETCKTCKRPIKSIQSEIPHGGFITYVWNCGHIEMKIKPKESKISNVFSVFNSPEIKAPEPTQKELYDDLDRWVSEGGAIKKSPEQIEAEERYARWQDPSFHSIDNSGYHAYEHQFECVEFGEAANGCFLNADDVGVGKTIETSIYLKRNLHKLKPVIILVPSSLVFQWADEIRRWVARRITTVMPVMKREHLMPGFDIYVMSRDLLGRKGVLDLVNKIGPKAVVIDEIHDFKDVFSQRTKALYKLIEDNNIKFKLPIGGTWIRNRFSEAFVPLNLIDPLHWKDQKAVDRFCDGDRLNHLRVDEFKRITQNYIIRRNKHDVLKNLPPLSRDFQLIEIEDEGIRQSYNHTLGLFPSFEVHDDPRTRSNKLLGWLAKLRSITGMAKTPYAVKWVKEFLEASEDSIVISIQHHDVRRLLFNVFEANGLKPLSLSGLDDAYDKRRIVQEFNRHKNIPLVINGLAGGVGLDGLQSCANALILERQWNSALEEQFEGRLHRNGQKNAVMATYPLARGTLDEYFHDRVYKTRNIASSVGIGTGDDSLNSLQSLIEFSEFVASHKI